MSEGSTSAERRAHPLDWRDWGVALLIFVVVLAMLLATMDIGFTRDESFYFHAARDYIKWFEELYRGIGDGTWRQSFQKAAIDRHWSYNHEHPVLMKTLFALSDALFHKKLEWMESSTAMRLPTAALSAMLCSGVYLFARQLFGRAAGVIAAGALILQPRFFFDAHMACFDAPIGAMWFLTVYAYWKSWESKRWAFATGVFWGLALATKLNAFFIPIVFVLHWLWATWRQWGVGRAESGEWVVRWPQMPWALVAMAGLGPLIFYLHWPYIWFDTFARVKWYMMFHLKHVHYFARYFGENLIRPPFPISFPFGMTVVTVPATILAASALGAGAYWSERGGKTRLGQTIAALRHKKLPTALEGHRATGMLLMLNFLVPILIIAQPHTPVFGGTKHWIPSMPFMAMIAGFGAVVAWERAVTWWERADRRMPGAARIALSFVVALAILLPAAGELHKSHPQGIAYYNELIGSYQGAADQGMLRQFWGYASRQTLPWVNEHAPKGSRIDPQNTTGWAWQELAREDLVRKDLKQGQRPGADYVLFEQQKAFHYIRHEMWRQYGVRAPSYVHEVDGVPLISVYEKPATRQKRLVPKKPETPTQTSGEKK